MKNTKDSKPVYTKADLERLLEIKDKEIQLLREFNDSLMKAIRAPQPYYTPWYSTSIGGTTWSSNDLNCPPATPQIYSAGTLTNCTSPLPTQLDQCVTSQ